MKKETLLKILSSFNIEVKDGKVKINDLLRIKEITSSNYDWEFIRLKGGNRYATDFNTSFIDAMVDPTEEKVWIMFEGDLRGHIKGLKFQGDVQKSKKMLEEYYEKNLKDKSPEEIKKLKDYVPPLSST